MAVASSGLGPCRGRCAARGIGLSPSRGGPPWHVRLRALGTQGVSGGRGAGTQEAEPVTAARRVVRDGRAHGGCCVLVPAS